MLRVVDGIARIVATEAATPGVQKYAVASHRHMVSVIAVIHQFRKC